MSNLPVLIVIPARAGSSRLPRKPLAMIAGKSLIERVWRQASQVEIASHVVVATDDEEIEATCKNFGAEVLMTSPEIKTGSERVAEAARIIAESQGKRPQDIWSCVVNVQGDMPFIQPAVVNQTASIIKNSDGGCDIATAATPIFNLEDFESNKIVKVVMSQDGYARYFSRAPIPCSRDGERFVEKDGTVIFGFKHIGLYAFNPASLETFTSLEQSPLEKIEMLEQLRALEQGMTIKVHIASASEIGPGVEVDTAEDLETASRVATGS